MKPAGVPNGFILFSEAIRRLQTTMWGGLPRPIALRNLRDLLRKEGSDTWVTIHTEDIRKTFGQEGLSSGPNICESWSKYRNREPAGFGPWRQKAGECLTQAALEGKCGVYLAPQDHGTPVCTGIPLNVLRRLITVRGSLPDQAFRPSIKACDGDRNLLLLLGRSRLVVAESEFNRWRDAEKRKRKWPSQRSRSYARAQLRRTGRPTKQTDDLRQAVLGLLREGVWSARQPIPDLQRRLIALGRDDVPSTDTLARLIDNLHDEIGSSGLRRTKRSRRQRPKRSAMAH